MDNFLDCKVVEYFKEKQYVNELKLNLIFYQILFRYFLLLSLKIWKFRILQRVQHFSKCQINSKYELKLLSFNNCFPLEEIWSSFV